MDKVILIMDKPESCSVCPLFGDVYTDMICKGNGHGIDYPYPEKFRQKWCPLNTMPEKDVLEQNESSINYFKRGWNACIDRILNEKGETE